MGVEVTVTPSKAKKVILWILIILIVLGGGAFAVWKFGVIDKILHPAPAPTPATNTPTTTTPTPTPSDTTPAGEETKTPIEEPGQEPLPEVAGDGTLTMDIGNVEFESKVIKAKDNSTTTKYKIASVTLSIANHQAGAVNLNGTLMVLDSKGNNAVSSNFVYKDLEIGSIAAGETYNRKQPVNTAGDIRPYLTGVVKGEQAQVQITLYDMDSNKVVKTSKKTVVVG